VIVGVIVGGIEGVSEVVGVLVGVWEGVSEIVGVTDGVGDGVKVGETVGVGVTKTSSAYS